MIDFNKQNKIHPCCLTNDDLVALVSLIKQDFPKSDRQEDFTIRTFSTIVNISEHSLKDFLKHDRLPSILTILTIEMIGWSTERDINKSLDITFYNNYIELRVSGASESWVNGKYIQITDFLKGKKPRFWFLHTTAAQVISGGIYTLLVIGISFLVTQVFIEGLESIGILIPLSIFLLGLLNFIIRKSKYTQIFIAKKQSFSDKYKDLITILLIIGTLFSIGGVMWQFLQK
jgi:hypothetical protein